MNVLHVRVHAIRTNHGGFRELALPIHPVVDHFLDGVHM
jgi:hypothetical protein